MAVADFSRINSNIAALNSLNSLNNVNKQLGMHQLRLATGKRINSAEDDPAGLTIATKFRSRNENIKTAIDNIGQGKNMLSVAEGGLNKIQDILVTMRKKAEEAANDTLGGDERAAISDQLAQFANEIDDIVSETTWNGKELLGGLTHATDTDKSFDGTIHLQTGAEFDNQTTLSGEDFGSVAIKGGQVGGDMVALASFVGTAIVASGVDGNNIIDAAATAATSNSNLAALKTGTYTVRVTYGAGTSATAGASSTVELLDANGNAMLIDTDGTTADGAVDAISTGFNLAATGGATQPFNFGNGLQVDITTLATSTAGGNGSFTATVDFTAVGDYKVSLNTASAATDYMKKVDDGIKVVSERLQTLGSLNSRLTIKEENLATAQVNTEAAYNRIMNADMAMSQMEATKFQILQQTATTMLAQANQAPQGLLSLFR
jgi:flagellin